MTGGNGLSKGVTFWGMVGATMTALKLKESWDDYRQVSSEEDGHGPLALHSPSDAPPSYRDDDLESAPLHGGLTVDTVDTDIPGARPKRKARKECCVCCGLRCGLFWKAFGLVSMIFIVWQVVRLVIWTVQPAKTGLEEMPAFSTSLGCLDAKNFYHDKENIVYSVAVNPSTSDHQLDLKGLAVGTLVIAAGAPGDDDVKLDMSLRSSQRDLLDLVVLDFPAADQINDGTSKSRVKLLTPHLSDACMRFDATLYVPTTLKHLRVEAQSVTHIKFDPNAELDMQVLSVVMFSADQKNLLLPTTGIHADHLSLEMTRGWLVGNVSIADKTSLVTQRGDATSNVKIHPLPSLGDVTTISTLQTTSGAGRSDFEWVGNPAVPHRQIKAVHWSSRYGDLHLTYKSAEFSGHVELKAKSYSVSGVQGLGLNRNGTELPWVGSKDGKDSVKASSPGGWVGLYF